MGYATFKAKVIGKHIGDKECVSLIVNNPASYSAYLWPGVTWTSIFKPVTGAKSLMAAVSTKYFIKITNDHANAAQLPRQGDVMVFDATPKAGYSNSFNNPYGHTGICDRATSSGYWLLQQNAPAAGQAVNVTYYAWKYRPCIGWLRPVAQAAPKPEPVKEATVPTLTTKADLDFLYPVYLGRARHGNEGEDVYLNKDYKFVSTDLFNSKAGKDYRAAEAKQVKSLNDSVAALTKQLNDLKTQLAAADDRNADLTTKMHLQADKIAELDKVVVNLQGKLAACDETAAPVTVGQAVTVFVQAVKAAWFSK